MTATNSTTTNTTAAAATGPTAAEPLARQLGALGVWLLVINGTIGAGIFGLPAEAARLAGGFSPWIFAICAGLMLPVMLCFAELASRVDGTGGPARYVGDAFGPFAGFQAGWAFYVARLTAFAANAVLLVGAIGHFWPGADDPGARLALLFIVCAALTALTAVGTRGAIGSLGVLTLLKFIPLVALVAYGLLRMPASVLDAVSAAPAPDAKLGAAVLLVFYAFVGFESGLVPAGEARDPRRDMPRALFLGLAVVALLYVGLQAVSLAALPGLAQTKRPLIEVASVLFGPGGALLMTAGLVVSVGANLVGSMFSTPRISYALALAGSLPAWFGRVAPRFGTPAVSIVVYGAAAFVLAAGGTFAWLAGLSVLTRVFIYLACIASLPAMRRRSDVAGEGGVADRKTIRLPGGFLIPVIAVLVCLALLTQVKPGDYVATAAMLAVGTVLFAGARLAGSGSRGPR
jgi:amino acid transporter